MPQTIAYRPEIDGLRALAVLSVLVYHLNHAWLPGGYLGVDVFFVISGFLITSIIMKELEAGDFSFARFYLRRARRILPASLAMAVLTSVTAYFVVFPDELRAAARACQQALFCCSNYFFARGDGYFDPSSESNLFLHTWSLGVEEQFYLIFPLMTATAYWWRRLKARYIGAFVIGGLVLASVATRLWPTHAFFALETRAWELAAGAWLAVAAARGTALRWLGAAGIGPLGVALMAGGLVFLGRSSLSPAPVAAPVVLGAMLFIGSRAGGEDGWVYRWFASAPMRFVGRISYSLYLVHWPVIVLLQARFGELPPVLTVTAASGALVLAAALHYAIEQPLRRGKRTRVFLAGVVGISALLLVAVGFTIRQKGAVNSGMAAVLRDILPESQVQAGAGRPSPHRIGRVNTEPTVGVWGDSHAMMFVPVLDAELQRRGLSGEVWSRPGNLPAEGVVLRGETTAFNDQAIAALSRLQMRHVIIAARWSSYLKGKPEDHRNIPRITGVKTPEAAQAMMRRGLDTALTRLVSPARNVLVVYPVPEAGMHVPYWLARRARAGQPTSNCVLAKPATEYAERHDLTVAVLDQLCDRYRLLAVHPSQMLIHDGVLHVSRNGLALYRDDDHLSRFGSEPVVREILDRLELTGTE